jgi:hypothetical protein
VTFELGGIGVVLLQARQDAQMILAMRNFTLALEAQLNEERQFRDAIEARNHELEAR